MGFNSFDMMFNIVPILMILFFIMFFGILIVQIVRGVSTWNKNNNSPRLTVNATIVDKHEDVSYHRHHHEHHTSSTRHTSYYVTFEVESGDRIVLKVAREEYGYLVINDVGQLTFQGTRYIGFERNKG